MSRATRKSTRPAGARQPIRTIETMRIADRLNDIRGHLAVVGLAVEGAAAESDNDHLFGPVTTMIDDIGDSIREVVADIHPPADLDAGRRVNLPDGKPATDTSIPAVEIAKRLNAINASLDDARRAIEGGGDGILSKVDKIQDAVTELVAEVYVEPDAELIARPGATETPAAEVVSLGLALEGDVNRLVNMIEVVGMIDFERQGEAGGGHTQVGYQLSTMIDEVQRMARKFRRTFYDTCWPGQDHSDVAA